MSKEEFKIVVGFPAYECSAEGKIKTVAGVPIIPDAKTGGKKVYLNSPQGGRVLVSISGIVLNTWGTARAATDLDAEEGKGAKADENAEVLTQGETPAGSAVITEPKKAEKKAKVKAPAKAEKPAKAAKVAKVKPVKAAKTPKAKKATVEKVADVPAKETADMKKRAAKVIASEISDTKKIWLMHKLGYSNGQVNEALKTTRTAFVVRRYSKKEHAALVKKVESIEL